MPRGPKGEKRPADAIGAAVMVMRIATGETEEECETKDSSAAARGRLDGQKGGPARADALTAARRKRIARKAARSRWAKKAPA